MPIKCGVFGELDFRNLSTLRGWREGREGGREGQLC